MNLFTFHNLHITTSYILYIAFTKSCWTIQLHCSNQGWIINWTKLATALGPKDLGFSWGQTINMNLNGKAFDTHTGVVKHSPLRLFRLKFSGDMLEIMWCHPNLLTNNDDNDANCPAHAGGKIANRKLRELSIKHSLCCTNAVLRRTLINVSQSIRGWTLGGKGL